MVVNYLLMNLIYISLINPNVKIFHVYVDQLCIFGEMFMKMFFALDWQHSPGLLRGWQEPSDLSHNCLPGSGVRRQSRDSNSGTPVEETSISATKLNAHFPAPL